MEKKAYTYWATDNSFYQFVRSKLQETLTLEHWLSMNASLGLVRIDKQYAQIYESRCLFFGNYKLYEMRTLSPVRTNSIRFLLNETKDNLIVLKMTNEPIYEMWENLTKAFPENKCLLHHPDPQRKTAEILSDYVKFFFSNVIGKYGPFNIVERLEDIKNRANNYYNLNPSDKPEAPHSTKTWENALSDCVNLYKHHEVTEITDEDPTGTEYIKEYYIENILVVFNASLFKSTVHVHTERERYGHVSLSQEKLGVLIESPTAPSGYSINFESTNDTDNTTDSVFPEFP